MATILLTWNPTRYPWPELPAMAQRTRAGEVLPFSWSCGQSKRIRPGDRVFLLRQSVAPRGIVASGQATGVPYPVPHWIPELAAAGRTTMCVEIALDVLLDPASEPILPREMLDGPQFSPMHWNTQMSGVRIPNEVAAELERAWARLAGREE